MNNLRGAIAGALVGRRCGGRPEASAFCDAAAASLERAAAIRSTIANVSASAFPPGSESREKAAVTALSNLQHSLARMTPTERTEAALRVLTDRAFELLGLQPEGHVGELTKLVELLNTVLAACDLGQVSPVPPTRDTRSWIPRVLAGCWLEHFGETPKASKNSPFYFVVVAASESCGVKPLAPATVQNCLRQMTQTAELET